MVSVADIGRMLGVSRQRAHELVDSPGFPAPVQQVGRSRVWRESEVKRWQRKQRGKDPREKARPA